MRRSLRVLLAAVVVVTAACLVARLRRASAIGISPAGVVSPATADALAPRSEVLKQGAPSGARSDAREPIDSDAAATLSRGLDARLVDRATREPIPFFRVGLRGAGAERAEIESDAEGRIRVATPWSAGRLGVHAIDDARLASAPPSSWHDHDPAHGQVEIPLEIGPTYRIDTVLPDGRSPDEFRLDLRGHAPRIGLAWTHGDRPPALLRRGERGYWARFRKRATVPAPPCWLTLASEDGLWVGGAYVQSTSGIQPDTVAIGLEPRCAVRGRFAPAGGPYERGASIAIERPGAVPPAILWNHVDRSGEFRVATLEPGRYRLVVRDPAFVAAPIEFELTGGELDLGVFDWTPLVLAGDVRVVLESSVDASIDMQLVRTHDTPRHPDFHSDSWEEVTPGRFESEFLFTEVFEGDYELHVHTHDVPPWQLAPVRVRPPQAELRVRLPEPEPLPRIEAVDTVTRARIDGAVLVAVGAHGLEELGTMPIELGSCLVDDEVLVIAHAPGYRLHVTRVGELVARERSADGALVVPLAPGWGGAFFARMADGDERVGGVEIRIGGETAAVTDERGLAFLERDAAPQSLELHHPTLECELREWDVEQHGVHRILAQMR